MHYIGLRATHATRLTIRQHCTAWAGLTTCAPHHGPYRYARSNCVHTAARDGSSRANARALQQPSTTPQNQDTRQAVAAACSRLIRRRTNPFPTRLAIEVVCCQKQVKRLLRWNGELWDRHLGVRPLRLIVEILHDSLQHRRRYVIKHDFTTTAFNERVRAQHGPNHPTVHGDFLLKNEDVLLGATRGCTQHG
jgi:hypothetical protein